MTPTSAAICATTYIQSTTHACSHKAAQSSRLTAIGARSLLTRHTGDPDVSRYLRNNLHPINNSRLLTQGCAVEPVNRNRSALPFDTPQLVTPTSAAICATTYIQSTTHACSHKAAQSSRLTAIGARSLLTRHTGDPDVIGWSALETTLAGPFLPLLSERGKCVAVPASSSGDVEN